MENISNISLSQIKQKLNNKNAVVNFFREQGKNGFNIYKK